MGRRDAIAADSRGEPAPHASVPAADDQRASFRATVNKDEVRLLLENYEDSRQGWFWSTDHDGRLTYLTDSVVTLLANQATRLAGAPFTELFQTSNEETKASRTLAFQLAKRLSFEKLALRAAVASDERWWAVSGNPQFDPSGQFTGYRGSAVDITEQRQTTKHASQLAMYDALTGLPNRRSMAVALEAHLVALKVQKRSCAVMLIDLDRFKQVNDRFGHAAGDQILKQFAQAMREAIRLHVDVGFRIGGDEFALVLPSSTCLQAAVVVERVRSFCELRDPLWAVGAIDFSAGSVEFDGDETAPALLARGDRAMYLQKQQRGAPAS